VFEIKTNCDPSPGMVYNGPAV